MADREPSTRGSAALKIRRASVQIRDLLASSTAAKYRSGAALQRSVGTPNAALTCSTPVGDTPARGSGRRAGSNPVTPTSVPAGRRPYPVRGGAFGLARTATKYRNGAHRRPSLSVLRETPRASPRFASCRRAGLRIDRPVCEGSVSDGDLKPIDR